MARPREHVRRAGLDGRVTRVSKGFDVARGGRRIAGNHHDAGRRHRGHGGDCCAIAAFSRRVEEDYIRRFSVSEKRVRNRSGVTTDEFGVADAVELRVDFCVLYGIGNDLNSDKLLNFFATERPMVPPPQ